MKTLIARASLLLMIAFVLSLGVAQAQTVVTVVTCASVGLTVPPGQQPEGVGTGAYCTQEVTVVGISRTIGNGQRCQDATITTTVVKMINKNGAEMTSRTTVSEPVESDWGASYPKPITGCNNPE